ncbi:hypothetical protein Clacol_007188 [Clathrus columnatus]|uniref:Uncharacterized protein n=1 Tax=Clathrus columnatus TaxID=1419009 RepID=A0AAV5AJ37_9AGAM|nr:hypothetical protein Clacol_007188 [Clathrus columnatus]
MISSDEPKYTEILCIGVGFSGICLGAQLKRKFGFIDIHFYDRNASVAGTWYANQYPGVACDIHAALYSFSFEPNFEWTTGLTDGEEIRAYLERVVDRYDLRQNMSFSVEWLSAKWDNSRQIWIVQLKDLKTDKTFVHECRILYSAVGQLVLPRKADIPGISTFKGEIIHTARWKKDVTLQDKNVVIVGNGCSATQVVPCIVKETKSLTQFFRSAQYMFPGSDAPVSSRIRWYFKNVPLLNRLLRFYIFSRLEKSWNLFTLTESGAKDREHMESISKNWILRAAPEKYRSILVPDYKIGCKRRIFDRGGAYMKSLHLSNMHLTKDPIEKIIPEGVCTADNVYPADVIILANGFETGLGGLNTVDVYGSGGQSLREYWKEFGGPTAYNCTAIPNCRTYANLRAVPNFFMLFGPNTATGHTSLILAIENTVNYTLKIIKPILTRKALTVDVKKDVAELYGRELQRASSNTVIGLCRSRLLPVLPTPAPQFYVKDGWNATIYPRSQYHFWWRSLFLPNQWNDWTYTYTSTYLKSRKLFLGISLACVILGATIIGKTPFFGSFEEFFRDTLLHIFDCSAALYERFTV